MAVEKQALRATFFAFRKRRGAGVLTGATLAYCAWVVLLGGAFTYFNWERFGVSLDWIVELVRLGERASTHPELVPAPPGELIALFGFYLLYLIPLFIVAAAYEAGCLRWLLRGERGGFFGLSLGADTWRCYGGYWVWFGLNFASSFAVGFVTTLVGLVIWRDGAEGAAGRDLFELFLKVALFYFVIRLAPANAASVGTRAFAFFKAWTVTRGRFFALLGSYLVAALIYVGGLAALAGAGYLLLWPTFAPLYEAAGRPTLEHWEALRGVIAGAFARTPFAVTAVALFAGASVWSLVFRLFHFGISARAVLAAQDEGRIERVAGQLPAGAPSPA